MIRFVGQRLFWTIPVLLGIALLMFFLMHLIPGSPWDHDPARLSLYTFSLDTTSRKTLDQRFGLDQPLWRQFVTYVVGDTDEDGQFVCGAICANLGPSYRQFGRSVQDILFAPPENKGFFESRFGYTIRLTAFAFLITLLAGIPIGVLSAIYQDSLFDRLSMILMTVSMSVPNFVIGLLLIVVLASGLGLIKVTPDWSRAGDWIVPCIVLAIAPIGTLARVTRTSVLEVMRREYVRTARSKGLTDQTVVIVHILKNAIIPIVTLMGPALVELIAASFVVEMMFGFPGLGREYAQALSTLDYSMILGLTLLYAVWISGVNLIADLLYGVLDPRIRVH